MAHDKIARMANQIAVFMQSKPAAEGVGLLAAHINDFWEPRMRSQLFALIDAQDPTLHPMVLLGAPLIRRPGPVAA